MATLARPFLGDSEQEPQRTPLAKVLLVSTVLLGLACAACGLLYRAGPSQNSLGGAQSVPQTDLRDWAKLPCYTVTGGTCFVQDCKPERHADCSFGSCLCSAGCVGADGNCYKDIKGYELVASKIRLRNIKFTDYLYTPRTWFLQQLRVTSTPRTYADKWNVYRVPGTAFEEEYYMISPVEYPGYAAGITTDMTVTAKVIVVDIRNNNQDPWGIFQYLCEPPHHPGAWQISNVHMQGQGVKWYVHHGSWRVFGYLWGALRAAADVGEGGEWMPEPPINLSLPRCG